MLTPQQILQDGPLHWFADWPVSAVPRTGAIVYTVWDRAGRFVYVGMAGRGLTASPNGNGPFGRLNSHASGRRSGDQFCIYIADRFVLPRIHNRVPEVADGTLSIDKFTKDYIRQELGFRFAQVLDGRQALALERDIQRGLLTAGKPLLNPITGARQA